MGAGGGAKLVAVFLSSSILIEMQIEYLLSELMAGLQTAKVSLMCAIQFSKVSVRKKNHQNTQNTKKVNLIICGIGNTKVHFYRKIKCDL